MCHHPHPLYLHTNESSQSTAHRSGAPAFRAHHSKNIPNVNQREQPSWTEVRKTDPELKLLLARPRSREGVHTRPDPAAETEPGGEAAECVPGERDGVGQIPAELPGSGGGEVSVRPDEGREEDAGLQLYERRDELREEVRLRHLPASL